MPFQSNDAREAQQVAALQRFLPAGVTIDALSDLVQLPVLRKDQLLKSQAENPPFGVMKATNVGRIFQSPGPIYEPGGISGDWWRFGRFFAAMGLGPQDIIQNTFAYHFTPAGAMFDSAAQAVGAAVFAAGPGQTRQQAEVAAAIGTTAYAGTPDYLATILTTAEELGLDLSRIKKAAVSAGPLFPQVRQSYTDRGILCRQCYGTAEAGLIAYETAESTDGMIIDDDVIVEIVVPGTGTPVAQGEIGEVLVTVLNPDNPLIRFSVGDLSAIMAGQSPCGRSNRRLVGWRGRADQSTKVKGMFIRPEQVAALMDRHPEIDRARVEVSHDGKSDLVTVKLEAVDTDAAQFQETVADVLKLRADIMLVGSGTLPRDGVLVSDLRPAVT